MYGVSALVIILRLVAKLKIQLRVGLDDGLMVLALLLGIGNMAFDTSGVKWGLGRHFYYLTPIQRVNSMRAEFLGQPIGESPLEMVYLNFPSLRILTRNRYTITNFRTHCVYGLSSATYRDQKDSKIFPLLLDGATRSHQRSHHYLNLGPVSPIRHSVGSCRPSRKMLEPRRSS